jgi:hypothetical protein
MTKIRLLPLVLALTIVTAPVATRAATPSNARHAWHVVAAMGMNVLPIASAFAAQRCLPGYIACKLSFATMGLLASGTQLLVGGDLDGAKRTAERAVGGDWLVLPRHLDTGVKPDPYPAATPRTGESPNLPNF